MSKRKKNTSYMDSRSSHTPTLSARPEIQPLGALMEIRAGVGGAEASLFAAQLHRMYTRFALKQGWATEIISASPQGSGFKEIIFKIDASAAYLSLRHESGVHCIQRVSPTDSRKRVHTSTATVALLPLVAQTAFALDMRELQLDTFRAAGHGGQGVNTTDSAVRITHIPSGLQAACQDERSQHRNRERALEVLRSRLYAATCAASAQDTQSLRRSQIQGGARAERIRTYNVPQDRLTDKRLAHNLRGLEKIFAGDLNTLVAELRRAN